MRLALAAILAAMVGTSAHGQLVVGNDQSGSASIYSIDVTTGAATPIYTSTGTDAKPWGMAYDPTSNTLYWNSGGNLYSSTFGNPLVPSAPIPLTFNAATVNYVALAWRAGRLLGTRNITTEAVYDIDPATGVGTQLFVYATAFDIGGLDVDQTNGKLYGLTDTAPSPDVRGLYEIDTAASTTTFKAGYPAGETDIDGLAVHNGVAYFVTDGPNTTQASFYVVDIATGAQTGTLPSPFTGSGTFSAATFVAQPSTGNGACCAGTTCSVTASAACAGANQQFAGSNSVCNVPGNTTNPCCKADFNKQGGLTVQDIFDFLTAYFSSSSLADASGDGTVTVQDIFDFLAAYFSGCP